MSLLLSRLQEHQKLLERWPFEINDATTNEVEACPSANLNGPSHSVSEVPNFKTIGEKLVKRGCSSGGGCKATFNTTALFCNPGGRSFQPKSTLNSAPKWCKKEQSKIDPSQLLDFVAVAGDVAEIKSIMAKKHAEVGVQTCISKLFNVYVARF